MDLNVLRLLLISSSRDSPGAQRVQGDIYTGMSKILYLLANIFIRDRKPVVQLTL